MAIRDRVAVVRQKLTCVNQGCVRIKRVTAPGEGARTIRIGRSIRRKLRHQDRRLRVIHVGAGDQLSPQASDVISLNHGVFRDLKLKTIVEVLRIRRPEVWVNHEGERNLRIEELAQTPARDERERIDGAGSKGVERIGDRVRTSTEAEIIQVAYVPEGRLTTELQVESPVFNVVEDSVSAAHDQLRVTKHVPRKANPWSKVVPVRGYHGAVWCSGVPRVEQSRRRAGEHRGLMAGEESDDVVMGIDLRRVVFVAQTVIESEALPDLPRVLPVEMERGGPDAVDGTGELEEIVREASNKIR